MGIWTLDLADLRLVASSICKENFGRSVSDPFGYGELLDAVHSDDKERMKVTVARSIEQRIDYDIEYKILTPKGEPARATWLIVYTLPAGNTIEQSLGCKMKPGRRWRMPSAVTCRRSSAASWRRAASRSMAPASSLSRA